MRGFTLVEMAVTILLIGLLLAFSVPAFQAASSTYQLKGTTENVAAQMRMSREKAIATGQQQTMHFTLNYPSGTEFDYHIHNGTYIPAMWKLPVGITYFWGAGTFSAYDLRPDGRVYWGGSPVSGLIILQDRKGRRDTVSVQASGLVLTK